MCKNLVSVCVPIYNCEKYIKQCVDTLLCQTYKNIEYILIDDASTDDTYNYLVRAIQNYPKKRDSVCLIKHDINRGVSSTRLEAISRAKGDFIIHCDGDDFVEPNWIERLVNKAITNNADMVYCWYYRNSEDGETILINKEKEITSPIEVIKAFFEARMHCSLWNKLYRKNIYELTGNIDCPKWINMCEDFRINAQLVINCKKIVMEPQALYHYRIAEKSLTGTRRNMQSFLSEIDNVLFFKRFLPSECLSSMEGYQRRTLVEALMCDAMPAKLWHSLWKDVKFKTYKANYPLKLKIVLYLACINQPLTIWLWKKLRNNRKRLSH